MGNTELVAWWGAITATLVLVWDIAKWAQSGPRLKKRIALNSYYDDGKILRREKNENGESITHEEYCHIELVNIGTMPTTIMGVSATHKKRRKELQMGVTQQVFTEHFGKKLPHVISPGEAWSCRLPMDRYARLLKRGTPEIHINVSHKDKPIIVRAKKTANQALRIMRDCK